jgi:excisionase family DNA binding protein
LAAKDGREANRVLKEQRNKKELVPGEVMTGAEVAAFLKVGIGAVRRWTREGKLKGHKLGGRGDWRYLKSDVIAFLFGNN